MIIPMRVVTILTLQSEELSALENLRALGVMQISPAEKFSTSTQEQNEKYLNAQRVFSRLSGFSPANTVNSTTEMSGENILFQAEKLFDQYDKKQSVLESTEQRLKVLAAWGEFNRSTLVELAQKGVYVTPCVGTFRDFEKAQKIANAVCQVIYQKKGEIGFVVITTSIANLEGLPKVNWQNDDDPKFLRQRVKEVSQELKEISSELGNLSALLPLAKQQLLELCDHAEFAQASDALSQHGAITALQGFVPLPELDKLRAIAKKCGWGLLIREPKANENVPVLIKDNKFTHIIKPLFDFLGVLPGYREMDVSGGVLIFFTIFYALIIGDAGYGALFLIGALLAKIIFRKKKSWQLPLRMFMILSIATIIWGGLTGNWFGTNAIPGLPWFTQSTKEVQNGKIQTFCFLLAMAQLTTGRVWRAINEGKLRKFGEHFGWILILWGNFFLTMKLIVWPGEFPKFMYYLYTLGLLLVILCGVDWRNVSAIFQFPFDIIGSFTDVLSYIRLFAVGMAGSCIASSFNGMALDVCKYSPWFIFFGILIIIAGHTLNIGLGFLSVLVHGVRLNTLEFSNHSGLSWSGQKFKPFRSNIETYSEEKENE